VRLVRGTNNKKLKKLEEVTGQKVYSFSLPPGGKCCPNSRVCKCRLNRKGHVIQEGPIRCYAISIYSRYNGVRALYNGNLKSLKRKLKSPNAVKLISRCIPSDAEIIRWNANGDFFSYSYFCTFVEVVKVRPWQHFYCHSKAVKFISQYLKKNGGLPPNLSISLSYGGTHDKLIPSLVNDYGMKFSQIVMDEEEGKTKGLKMDANDSKAALSPQSRIFHRVHGIQQKDFYRENKTCPK